MSTSHEPNEYGFAGGATAPEPDTEQPDAAEEAEEIAVPDAAYLPTGSPAGADEPDDEQ